MDKHWIVIGNPENRRITFFQDALKKAGQLPASVFSYQQLVGQAGLCLSPLVTQLRGRGQVVVRIESPGENFRTTQLMLSLGSELAKQEGGPFLTCEEVWRLEEAKGEILYPRQWYLGFQHFLRKVEIEVSRVDNALFMNSPSEIAIMFDKRRCSEMFVERAIPTPSSLGPIESYDELIERMGQRGVRRVFVKLAHGSSASGVVAFEIAGDRQRAITSAELVSGPNGIRVFNSLTIRTYTDLDVIRDLIDWLCSHHVHVEEWIPKAKTGGRNFDCRFVVIGESCGHFVVRASEVPLTNLHLGSQRVSELPESCGVSQQSVVSVCQRAMELFPGSMYAGVDVCIDRNTGQIYVLELNAFGDLLPGINFDGESTYDCEVRTQIESGLEIGSG